MRTVLSSDWLGADGDAAIMGTLSFLNALTRDPISVDAGTIQMALATGVSAAALEQASLMVMVFSYMNRMVDAFGADVTPEQAEHLAGVLETMGGGAELLSRERPWERFNGTTPPPLLAQLDVIRTGDGDAPAGLRAAIEADVARRSGGIRDPMPALPPALLRLVDTLVEDAHGVTDEHIDDLRADWSEEAIYEFIFVASFAAGLGRLERAITLLGRI